jgi:hypothetical protein
MSRLTWGELHNHSAYAATDRHHTRLAQAASDVPEAAPGYQSVTDTSNNRVVIVRRVGNQFFGTLCRFVPNRINLLFVRWILWITEYVRLLTSHLSEPQFYRRELRLVGLVCGRIQFGNNNMSRNAVILADFYRKSKRLYQ